MRFARGRAGHRAAAEQPACRVPLGPAAASRDVPRDVPVVQPALRQRSRRDPRLRAPLVARIAGEAADFAAADAPVQRRRGDAPAGVAALEARRDVAEAQAEARRDVAVAALEAQRDVAAAELADSALGGLGRPVGRQAPVVWQAEAWAGLFSHRAYWAQAAAPARVVRAQPARSAHASRLGRPLTIPFRPIVQSERVSSWFPHSMVLSAWVTSPVRPNYGVTAGHVEPSAQP